MEDDVRLLAVLFACPEAEAELRTRLERRQGWLGVWRAGPADLAEKLPPEARPRVEALFDLVRRWLASPSLPPTVDGPHALAAVLRPRLAAESAESFWVALLDARARLIGLERVALGTLTACLVHPREVFAPALAVRAASVVVVHNHPSGDPSPSAEDEVLTERLVSAGRLLGIPVVDHIVVAREGVRSVMEADAVGPTAVVAEPGLWP